MASCCRRLIQPARIKSKNCHGCNCAFIFLRMRGENPQHPASWVTCQAAHRDSAAFSPRHVFSVACGSAEYFNHTGFRGARRLGLRMGLGTNGYENGKCEPGCNLHWNAPPKRVC